MIDPKIWTGKPNEDDWHLDINIIKGRFEDVDIPTDVNTRQQRTAVLAYQARSSIPGDWERGVDWGAISSQPDLQIAQAMMQVQIALGDDNINPVDASYNIPLVGVDSDGAIKVQIINLSPKIIEELSHA